MRQRFAVLLGVLLLAGALGACNRDAAAPVAAPEAADAGTADVAPPAAEVEVPPTDEYRIPPFPVTGVETCDRYASEARRCLNEHGKDDEQRVVWETDILKLLDEVAPEPGELPNPWREGDCRRGLESLVRRFPTCDVQQ